MVEPTLNRLLVRAAGRIYSSLAIAKRDAIPTLPLAAWQELKAVHERLTLAIRRSGPGRPNSFVSMSNTPRTSSSAGLKSARTAARTFLSQRCLLHRMSCIASWFRSVKSSRRCGSTCRPRASP